MGFKGMTDIDSFKEYVDGLEQEYAWGNYMTLFAVANKFRVRVNIVCSLAFEKMVVVKEIEPADKRYEDEIFVSYIYYASDNAHYDALIKKREDGYVSPPKLDHVEVFVKNLPDFVTDSVLSHVFWQFGYVMEARVIDKKLGVGLVQMKHPHQMHVAVTAMNGKAWPGTTKIVEVALVKVNY